MWIQPTEGTQTASDDYSQKSINIGGKIKLIGGESTAGAISPFLHKIDHLLVWDWGRLRVSGATIVPKASTSTNVIKLSNNSNVKSILENISSKPQSGVKLLQLSGVFEGEPDMSSDKKKYLDEQ